MGTGKDPRVQEALRLAKVGGKARAHDLLVEVINQDRDNFDAWVIMAQVSIDSQEAIVCMKQALRLRPDDKRAKRYLEQLLQGDQKSGDDKARVSPWLWGGLGLALIALLVVGAAFVFFWLDSQGQTEVAQLLDILPVASTTQTGTSQPTDMPSKTPEVTVSPTVEPTTSATPILTSTLTPTSTSTPTLTPTATLTPAFTLTVTELTPTEITQESSTVTTEGSTDPCAAFTFGELAVNPDKKTIRVDVSHPSGATLTNIMVAWSMDGSLDKISHGTAVLNASAANPPGVFSMSEPIGAADSLEFWFSADSLPSTGYTIILTFDGGCTKPIM